MPRPKRTRGVATRRANQEAEQPELAAMKESSRDAAVVSSPDVGLSSNRETRRTTRGRQSGIPALDDNSVLQGAQSKIEVAMGTRQALETSRIRRDESMARLDDLTSTTNAFNTSDDIESPPEMGRRSVASVRRGRPTDMSGLDLDDDTFGDLDDSLVGQDESLTLPHSTETSSLNVSAFRKRPRKSSIVGRDDAPIRPSSRGTNTPGISSTFSFGHFKRRPRAPSILSAGRKGRSHSRQPYASSDETDNDRDFTRTIDRPTPMRQASRQPSAAPSSVGSRQASSTLRTRKRKSLEDHGSANKRAALEDSDGGDDNGDVRDSVELGDSPVSAAPRGRSPPRLATPDVPDVDDPDLAPPMSSGSSDAGGAAVWPPIESLSHRSYRSRRPTSRAQKTPELDDSGSDISSPPSLTHSPNLRPVRARRNAPAPAAKKKVTTAELASLLPRRRHKQASSNPFDISSDAEDDGSAMGNNDDELSYTAARATRASKRSSRAQANAKSDAAKDKQTAGARKSARRTYGSRGSDKENQDEEEVIDEDGDEVEFPDAETSQLMLEKLGEELKNAAKKFKEVDKWQLEFEEDNEPSSPVDAR